MESGKNGNTVLMTVIGVATLLVALVGATFAYFSATVDNQQAQSVTITTATPVGLQYVGNVGADTPLAIENALPGDYDSRTFTVTNPTQLDGDKNVGLTQTYDLTLKIDKNEFTNEVGANDVEPDGERNFQLLVTITAKSSIEDRTELQVPELKTSDPIVLNGQTEETTVQYSLNLTNGTTDDFVICNDQSIASGETISYTIKLEFINLAISQNANQGKNFTAYVEISDPRTI